MHKIELNFFKQFDQKTYNLRYCQGDGKQRKKDNRMEKSKKVY